MSEIKTIFFRIIFNLPLGIAFICLVAFFSQEVVNALYTKIIVYKELLYIFPGWFWAFLCLSIILVIGEIVSNLGEWLFNWMYGFPLFFNSSNRYNIENIIPLSSCLVIDGFTFVKSFESRKNVSDFTEMHFAFFRLYSGMAWIGLLCFFLLIKQVSSFCVFYHFFILLIFLIYIIFYMLQKSVNYTAKLFLLFLLSVLFAFFLAHISYSKLYFLVLIIIFTIFVSVSCILYRSFSNYIIWISGNCGRK